MLVALQPQINLIVKRKKEVFDILKIVDSRLIVVVIVMSADVDKFS